MSAITWTDVQNICTNAVDQAIIVAVSGPGQNAILADVNTRLVVKFFPPLFEESPKLKNARCYLAAHMAIALGKRATIVTSEGELDLSTGYGIVPYPPGDDPFWLLSGYGLAYLTLVRTTAARLPFVI